MKDAIIPYIISESIAQFSNIYEVRLFGYIIAKAQSVMKVYNKNLDAINLQHAMNLVRITIPARYLLSYGDNNYKYVKKAFTLADKRIDYERDNIEYHLHIIAFPELIKDGHNSKVTFVIHNELWNALLNFAKGYRLVNLPTFLKLNSTYAVVMMILVSQQTQPMTYKLDTLRRILGCANCKAYERTYNFMARVIEPAKSELDQKSPYSFHYSMKREGTGGAYRSITIIPTRNTTYTEIELTEDERRTLERQRIRLDERVVEYLTNAYEMTPREIETIEIMVADRGEPEEQVRWLAEVRTNAKRARAANVKGYLVNALKGAV